MQILISHDIDHLGIKEHLFKDLILPKYVCWSSLELLQRKINSKTFIKKISSLFQKNAWNHLEELLKFNQANGVKATFFVAVNNDKGISYSQQQAAKAIELIKKYDLDVGVHGICYDNYLSIKREFQDFKKISGLANFGIRMHYLRMNKYTLTNLAKAGYAFDSTVFTTNTKQQYRLGRLIEFPFHIMNQNIFNNKTGFNLQQAKQKTINIINQAKRQNKKYIATLFHQRHFGNDFPHYKEWYLWFINYCQQKKYQFVNYRDLMNF